MSLIRAGLDGWVAAFRVLSRTVSRSSSHHQRETVDGQDICDR